jgi:tetratricopeptide (TPR) repeat protein
MRALALGNLTEAMALFDTAIALNAHHSNSFFARGKCYFLLDDFEKARVDFMEAIRLSHQKHDSYHRAASEEHLQRGRGFLKLGKLDLAINDFTKALDLHRKNKDALAARAQAYRAKGSVQLAEIDERESGRVGE